jgi:hypothetical protein
MKHVKSLLLAAFAVVLATTYVIPAASASAASQTSSSALSIAPKKNYVIEPGKSVQDNLTITNLDETSPLDLTLRVIDFSYTDNGGTPKLMLDANAPQTTWSLRSYLKVPETVTVEPGQTTVLSCIHRAVVRAEMWA